MSENFCWTDQKLDRLRRLYGEGLSMQAMAEVLGTTKNSIVGKCHRLGLPARPSPIIRDRAPRPRVVRRAPLRTLNLEPAPAVPVAVNTPRPVVVMLAQTVRPAPLPRPLSARHRCCWPLWGFDRPTAAERLFCEKPAKVEPDGAVRPYCPDHCAVAYVPVRDRREAA